ncbi:MAG: esterase [Sphingobacteriales bacterium BACL12 MAG-120813-bin55]|jgi:enterochelin esterase-like enzyme|nr:MAG: esterase [Sphingobacteriales bacterium BACL12 MAG-120813-bin55]
MKNLLLICMLSISSLMAQKPEVYSGQIDILPIEASAYIAPRNVYVWLPDGYDPKISYSVLYMHDGQMLFDANTTWNKQEWGVDEVLSGLMAEGKMQPCIVVGVANIPSIRHYEYAPQKAFSYLDEEDFELLSTHQQSRSFEPDSLRADNYLRFLVEELKPMIDKQYSTLSDQAHTFIAGSSMGGLISMYAMCEYPQVFGGAACLSTHWPGLFQVENNPVGAAFLHYFEEHLPAPGNNRWYFDFGTATLDAIYEPYQQQADAILQAAGYNATNWTTMKFEGDDHSENAWKGRLSYPVLFLLGKE